MRPTTDILIHHLDHQVGTHQVKNTVDVLLRYRMILDKEETCDWISLAGHMASYEFRA